MMEASSSLPTSQSSSPLYQFVGLSSPRLSSPERVEFLSHNIDSNDDSRFFVQKSPILNTPKRFLAQAYENSPMSICTPAKQEQSPLKGKMDIDIGSPTPCFRSGALFSPLLNLPRIPNSNHWRNIKQDSEKNKENVYIFGKSLTQPTNQRAPVYPQVRPRAPLKPVPDSSTPKLRRTQSQCYTEEAFLNVSNKEVCPVAETGEQCHLPFIEAGKDAIKRIVPETLSKLLDGGYDHLMDHYYIIDCRFPYEFNGGHIIGARNINTMEELDQLFLKTPMIDKRVTIIFHCEFSSHRAPRMALHLRREDRKMNMEKYPSLFYPEIYVLEGGYKTFFRECKEYCFPQEYIEMKDASFRQDCRREMSTYKRSWRRTKSYSDAPSSFYQQISSMRCTKSEEVSSDEDDDKPVLNQKNLFS